MEKGAKARLFEAVQDAPRQQDVLENAAGESHNLEPAAVAYELTTGYHGAGEAVVEAGRDDGWRHPGEQVVDRRSHQLDPGKTERPSAR